MKNDDHHSYSDMYIAFITFDGEVIEKGIDTPKPRNEFEIAMGMVYHRQLSFAQAVILYDNRHVEICRFEVNKSLYGHIHTVSEYQRKATVEMSPQQKKQLWVREEKRVKIQRNAYK